MVQADLLKAGAFGAIIATVVTMVFFDDDRRDAKKWRRHLDYETKCIEFKDDGTRIDQCRRQQEQSLRALELWSDRCANPERRPPADCERRYQALK
jgi:hypothetical protein